MCSETGPWSYGPDGRHPERHPHREGPFTRENVIGNRRSLPPGGAEHQMMHVCGLFVTVWRSRWVDVVDGPLRGEGHRVGWTRAALRRSCLTSRTGGWECASDGNFGWGVPRCPGAAGSLCERLVSRVPLARDNDHGYSCGDGSAAEQGPPLLRCTPMRPGRQRGVKRAGLARARKRSPVAKSSRRDDGAAGRHRGGAPKRPLDAGWSPVQSTSSATTILAWPTINGEDWAGVGTTEGSGRTRIRPCSGHLLAG